jgi:hypothetical protein
VSQAPSGKPLESEVVEGDGLLKVVRTLEPKDWMLVCLDLKKEMDRKLVKGEEKKQTKQEGRKQKSTLVLGDEALAKVEILGSKNRDLVVVHQSWATAMGMEMAMWRRIEREKKAKAKEMPPWKGQEKLLDEEQEEVEHLRVEDQQSFHLFGSETQLLSR